MKRKGVFHSALVLVVVLQLAKGLPNKPSGIINLGLFYVCTISQFIPLLSCTATYETLRLVYNYDASVKMLTLRWNILIER